MSLSREDARARINNHPVFSKPPEDRIEYLKQNGFPQFMEDLLIAIGLVERQEQKLNHEFDESDRRTGRARNALLETEERLNRPLSAGHILDDILECYPVFQEKTVPAAMKSFDPLQNDDFCGYVIHGFQLFHRSNALNQRRNEQAAFIPPPENLTWRAVDTIDKWLRKKGETPDQLPTGVLSLCAKENGMTEEEVLQILFYLQTRTVGHINARIGDESGTELADILPGGDTPVEEPFSLEEKPVLNLVKTFNLAAFPEKEKKREIFHVLLTQEILKPLKKPFDTENIDSSSYNNHFDYLNTLEELENQLFYYIFDQKYLCLALIQPPEPDTIRNIDVCENDEKYTVLKDAGVAKRFGCSTAYISTIRNGAYKEWHNSVPKSIKQER